jgi:hypothetical protein
MRREMSAYFMLNWRHYIGGEHRYIMGHSWLAIGIPNRLKIVVRVRLHPLESLESLGRIPGD